MERVISAIDKVPPQSLEAEQSTLGSMMLEASALDKGLGMLRASDFYRPAHQEVFDALKSLRERDEPADLITLQEALREHGKLEDCGGTEYLMALVESVPTAANIEHYAAIVRRKAKFRKHIAFGSEVIGKARNEDDDIDQWIEEYALDADGSNGNGFRKGTDILHNVWERLDSYSKGERPWGVPFRIDRLNRFTNGGCLAGEFVLFVADTSQGKSIALMETAAEAIMRDIPTLFISCEMSGEEVLQRMVCSRASVDMHEAVHGNFDNKAWERLTRGHNDLYRDCLTVKDKAPTISELLTDCRRWAIANTKLENGVRKGFIVIDYVGLIDQEDPRSNENEATKRAMQAVKRLAQNLRLPIASAAQIRKMPAGHKAEIEYDETGALKPKWFTLDDIFGSGEAKKSPDKVIPIYNPIEATTDYEGKRMAFFKLAKHRNGPAGQVIECIFWPKYARFDNIDDYERSE